MKSFDINMAWSLINTGFKKQAAYQFEQYHFLKRNENYVSLFHVAGNMSGSLVLKSYYLDA